MSALTKVFVVLLVVCSMLFTAATVVFINRTENYRLAQEATEARLKAEKQRADALAADAATARDQAVENLKTANLQMEAVKKDRDAALLLSADKDVKIATEKASSGLKDIQINQITEALKASEDQKARQWQEVVALRKKTDELTGQNVDLNKRNTELTSVLEQTERDRKFLTEQVVQFQGDSARLNAALKDAGIQPQQAISTAGTRAGAPAINGVVRGVRDIEGKPYATISVGSADSVVKGMEFKVIDRDAGLFLGILVIDDVQMNESTGHLAGPKITEVKTGNEVRTQL